MLIITNLQELLKSTALTKGCTVPIRVRYNADDRLTIPEHELLQNSKMNITFQETEGAEDFISVCLSLGKLMQDEGMISYVTNNSDMLSKGIFSDGKHSVSFVNTFDDAVKVFGKSGKGSGKIAEKKVTRTRKPRAVKKTVSEPTHTEPVEKDEDTKDELPATLSDGVLGAMNPPAAMDTATDTEPSFDDVDDSDIAEPKPVKQEWLNGTFDGTPAENVSKMLFDIDPSMPDAAPFIIEAIRNSNNHIDFESMLSMVAEKKFVKKWLHGLTLHFDQLKSEVNKIKRYTPMDEVYRG